MNEKIENHCFVIWKIWSQTAWFAVNFSPLLMVSGRITIKTLTTIFVNITFLFQCKSQKVGIAR